jgi:hypothetical protein
MAIALRLVKPTEYFLDLWLQLDDNLTEIVAHPVSDLDRFITAPYLQYQQHNVITESDVQRATGLVPRLSKALDPAYGSWDHPFLPIHRAVMFFCQGHSVTPTTPNQFLWAAGTLVELGNVSRDIFSLRNAFAHGLPIPNAAWLSAKGQPFESEYAYQLWEQTEIALRLTLLRILEDQKLFDTFSDSALLDSFF